MVEPSAFSRHGIPAFEAAFVFEIEAFRIPPFGPYSQRPAISPAPYAEVPWHVTTSASGTPCTILDRHASTERLLNLFHHQRWMREYLAPSWAELGAAILAFQRGFKPFDGA
jgi:hypothetical protein